MKLIDIVGGLASFDGENTIYASEPWTADCEAIVTSRSEIESVYAAYRKTRENPENP